MTASATEQPPDPRLSIAEIQRMTSDRLSLPYRIGYSALLVASLTMTVVVGSLLATEPILPGRTTSPSLSWSASALAGQRLRRGCSRPVTCCSGGIV